MQAVLRSFAAAAAFAGIDWEAIEAVWREFVLRLDQPKKG